MTTCEIFWWLPECIWGLPKCLSWGLFLDSFHRQLVTSAVCWYITLFGFINFFTFSPAMLFNSLLVLVSLLLLKLDYHFEWPEPINPIKISTIEPCDQYNFGTQTSAIAIESLRLSPPYCVMKRIMAGSTSRGSSTWLSWKCRRLRCRQKLFLKTFNIFLVKIFLSRLSCFSIR